MRREIEGLREDVTEGFQTLSYQLADISSDLQELNSSMHWGFSELISGVGQINDSLAALIQIAKTPAQAWAYEQYEIARDASRKHLYPEALEALDHAINGFGDHTGYRLEWRFQRL